MRVRRRDEVTPLLILLVGAGEELGEQARVLNGPS
jgi:hypothetical protein